MNPPKGWKLVPVEPTPEMIAATADESRDWEDSDIYKAMLANAPTPPAQHLDDFSVDLFAQAMKEKLAEKRSQGYGGWDDETVCSIEFLQKRLDSHIEKGDPVDVGNFAMMLHQRGASTAPPVQEDEPVLWVSWATLISGYALPSVTRGKGEYHNTPLYTRPQSDELVNTLRDITTSWKTGVMDGTTAMVEVAAALEKE